MKIIPILRHTISPNPDYRKTFAMVKGIKSVTFIIKGDNVPDGLKEGKDYTVFAESNGTRQCQLFDPSKGELVKNHQACFSQDMIFVDFAAPPSEYLFDYDLSTEICCLSCGKKSAIKDIVSYDFEGRPIDICPHCDDVDIFEPYEFEKLNTSKNEPRKFKQRYSS